MPATMPRTAASQAGFTRFRPVLMTALAMIIGMMPMALGLGDGGEQNAPLGRAVIGGLIFATVATLFFVPTVFAIIHGRARQASSTPASDSLRKQAHDVRHFDPSPARATTSAAHRSAMRGSRSSSPWCWPSGVSSAACMRARRSRRKPATRRFRRSSTLKPARSPAPRSWCCRATCRPSSRRRSTRAPAAI